MTISAQLPRRRSRYRRWRRRAAPYLPWLIGGSVLLLVVLVYLAAGALAAARHASNAAGALSRVESDLRAGSLPAARSDAARAARASRSAKSEVGGAIFGLAANTPFLGEPLQSLRQTTSVLEDVTQRVVLPVVNRADVRLETSVRGTSFDLTALSAAAPTLAEASTRLDADMRRLSRVRGVGVGSIDRTLLAGRDRVQSAARLLRVVSDTARLAPPMLSDGRRYLVLIQNNAESRATGGLIGAYAVVRVDGHRLHLQEAGSDNDLRDVRSPVISTDSAFDNRYEGLGVTTTWRSLNLTPDFPTAASIAARLWSATGHEAVDGVLAVDPNALSDLLRITGPLSVNGGPRISATNAVSYLESKIYTDFPRTADSQRNLYLASVTRSVFEALSSRHIDGKRLLRTLGHSVAGRHVQLWSAHSGEEDVLAELAISGAIPRHAGPFLEVVTQNLTGGKVDYYVRRRVSYIATTAPQGDDVGAGPQPMDDAVVTVTLTNTAPDHGLAPYVALRPDLPPGTAARPGTDRLWLSLYLARGTGYVSATIDGKSEALHTDEDAGATVLSTVVELAPGQSRTLRVHLFQPAEDGAGFSYLPQPLVMPDVVEVRRS